MNNSEEKVFDIRDFVAELVCRWKGILLTVILLTVVIVGAGAFRKWRELNAVPALEQKADQTANIEETRSRLNSAQAQEVEDLYSQYLTYQEYRRTIQRDFDEYSDINKETDESMILLKACYMVTAAVDEQADLYGSLSLKETDFEAIRKYLPEVDSLSSLRKYLRTTRIKSSGNVLDARQINEEEFSGKSVLYVEILGKDKETCSGIWEIVDEALKRESRTFRKVDGVSKLELIETTFDMDSHNFASDSQKDIFETMQKVDTALNNLKNNFIERLSAEQKEYYTALRYPETSGETVPEQGKAGKAALNPASLISKKLLVLGILLSLFLACGVTMLRYLLNGVIHVKEELEIRYHLPVLASFYYETGKNKTVRKIMRALKRADSTFPRVKAAVAAADLVGMVVKSGTDSLYFLRTTDDVRDKNTADMVGREINDLPGDIRVRTGIPASNVHEMKTLIGEKNVVLLVHTGKTTRTDLENILNLCGRQDISVLGTLVITDI